MDNDIRTWYDSLYPCWGNNYSSQNKHFMRRLNNVHQLIAGIGDHSRVLDVGCGTGDITASVHEKYHCSIIGIDNSEKMIAACRERYRDPEIHFEVGDALNLRFVGDAFDLVLSLSVIEWIEDYEKALSEVARVLKPGGQWIVSIPNWTSVLRKIEYLRAVIVRNRYLKYQKNRVSIRTFRDIAGACGLHVSRSVYHVMPLYSGNIHGMPGSLLGMLCMMSLIKS